jgi:hypothetical protein
MHARGTAEVLTWPSINHPALTGQGGSDGGGFSGGVPTVHPLASAPADVPCAPHARPNIPIKYCLLAQENQKKAKTAKPLFYERSRRHHAALTRTAAAAQTRTAAEDAAGRRTIRRRVGLRGRSSMHHTALTRTLAAKTAGMSRPPRKQPACLDLRGKTKRKQKLQKLSFTDEAAGTMRRRLGGQLRRRLGRQLNTQQAPRGSGTLRLRLALDEIAEAPFGADKQTSGVSRRS